MNYIATPVSKILDIKEIISVHYFAYTKHFIFTGESHNFWELVYCDSGEALVTDNDRSFLLPSGSIFLHAPNHFHNVKPNNKFTNVAIFSFSGNLKLLFDCIEKPVALAAEDKYFIKTILMEGKRCFTDKLDIVDQMQLNLSGAAPIGSLHTIKNCLELLLISLLRFDEKNAKNEKKEEHNQNYHDYIAGLIKNMLQENLDKTLRLQDIAFKLGYSPTYLKKLFKEQTGTPIIQYFIKLKIEKAQQLMSESTYSVSQISEMLGFESLQYFSRRFKVVTNMSPTEYIKSIKLSNLL